MAVDRIAQGQTVQFSTQFRNEAGTAPLTVTELVRFAVRDHAGGLIDEGVAEQGQADPSRWTANITIPSSAPVSPDGTRYGITWTAKTATGTDRQTDYFTVVGTSKFGSDLIELDQLVMENSKLTDTLYIDSMSTVNAYTIKLLTLDGTELYSFTNSSPSATSTGDLKAYAHTSAETVSGMVADAQGFKPLIIEWTFTADGVPGFKEYHFLYVATPKVLHQIRDLRLLIDKGRRNHPNPALNYSDLDLAGYLGQGAEILNGIKPVLTYWTPNTVPPNFMLSLTYAAAYSALTAQYLAEGNAAFDFSGQTVSLSVDRTPFIDATLGRLKDYLDTNVPTMKRNWVRSGGSGGGQGILGLNFGPSTPFANRDARYLFYRQFVGLRF